jgi:hypothetical protein
MADYFVRISGNNSNAGTSASAAWRTFGKALGSAGISSGDRLFVGAGVYREVVTVNMTSATVETQIIGDIDGSMTGDAGEIQWTAYTVNDKTVPSGTANLTLNTRDFLTFKNIVFISGTANFIINTSATSTDIKILNCCFNNLEHNDSIFISVGFGIYTNWTIDSCIFMQYYGSGFGIEISLATGVGSDYDAGITISNCLFIGSSGIVVGTSGTSVNEGGNVLVINCTFLASQGIQTSGTRVGGANFIYPIKIMNCLIHGRVGNVSINAGEQGAIIENYNLIYNSAARINVSIGPQSMSDRSIPPIIEFGQSFLYNLRPRPFGMLLKNSPLLGYADKTLLPPLSQDILGNPREGGINNLLYKGTASSATIVTLSDTSKNFGSDNNLNGYTIKILDGVGKGQFKSINGNTNTTISGDGIWLTIPNSTSKYVIYAGKNS